MSGAATLKRTLRRHSVGALLSACALAACQRAPAPATAPQGLAASPAAALPLSFGAAPAALAPLVAALPAHPVRVGGVADARDRYAYVDRAVQVSYGYGDAPPDYDFDFQGERPWIWRMADGDVLLVEFLSDGGLLYYYYAPGSDLPYLVRDPDYVYGFEAGVLVVVYDVFGRPLPDDYRHRRCNEAGRYLFRGQDLYRAGLRASRFGVPRDQWYAWRPRIAQAVAAWVDASQRDAGWRAYHEMITQTGPGLQRQAAWAAERAGREAYAVRVDQANNAVRALGAERQAAVEAANAALVAEAVNSRLAPQNEPPRPIGSQPGADLRRAERRPATQDSGVRTGEDDELAQRAQPDARRWLAANIDTVEAPRAERHVADTRRRAEQTAERMEAAAAEMRELRQAAAAELRAERAEAIERAQAEREETREARAEPTRGRPVEVVRGRR